jgi:tRNA(fMet)-specific endonuclease VapC
MKMEINRGRGISVLIDTDIVIDFLRRKEYARELLEQHAEHGLLAVSTLTHLEIYQGMRKGEETATNAFLDGMIAIPVDIPLARLAGGMLGELRSRGITVGIADAIIAATAITLDTPLLTNNTAHYPFEGLKLMRGLAI